MVELKEIFEWFLLRASFAALSALTVGFVLYYLADKFGNVIVKRCGVPFAVLFALSSAWAAYTAFPSSDEKMAQKYSLYHIPSEAKPDAVSPTLLTPEDFARGYVLTRAVSNEVHDFTAPADAHICEKWRRRGAYRDRICISSSQDLPWSFPFAASMFDKIIVRSSGVVELGEALARLEPFKGNLGIVPEANWAGISSLIHHPSSLFWHCLTPSNSLQLTWQNVLHDRLVESPISFQTEFFENGNFIYRYDLSSIGSNLTSRVFHRLDPSDSPRSDRDGDGIKIEDEIFQYGTDPYSRDTDIDGLNDYEEIFVYGLNPKNPYSLSDIYCDGIAVKLGDVDPFAFPAGSTNAVLEHVFYSGTTNGAFAYPQSSDSRAVLKISVSGSGYGDLLVGENAVPLLAGPTMQRSAPVPYELSLSVPKGVTLSLKKRGDQSIDVALDSSDFAFGELPTGGRPGWIHFPNTRADMPCIHDFNARKKTVSLPAGRDADDLRCSWVGDNGVEVVNIPPRSAEITGRFDPRAESALTYTLSHPRYLFGATAYSQSVRFCPKPPEAAEGEYGEPWYSGGSLFEDGDGWYCPTCDLGLCKGSCWCGCVCPGEDEDGVGNEVVQNDEVCPEHNTPYLSCLDLHEEEYANVVENAQQLEGVLYIRNPAVYEEIYLELPGEYRNCCSCPEHQTNYVSVAYKSARLSLVDSEGSRFEATDKNCTVNLAGIRPSRAVGDAQLAFSRNGEVYLQFSKTVLGVDIKCATSACQELNDALGCPVTVGTNMQNLAELRLVTGVGLPDGNIRLELADVSGNFTLWYVDASTGLYHKLLDSDVMPIKNLSFENWKKLLYRAAEVESAELPLYVTSSEKGTARLDFCYWNLVDGKLIRDSAQCRLRAIDPPILADMNHDGKIDGEDVGEVVGSKKFRFWTNEEAEKGDFSGQVENKSFNTNDLVVNGTYDLINFFPLKVDIMPLLSAWGDEVTCRIRSSAAQNGAFDFCFAKVSPSDVTAMQTEIVFDSKGTKLSEADLIALSSKGYVFSNEELARLSSGEEMLVMEANVANATIELSVEYEGSPIYSYTVPLSISSIEQMYRYLNLRWVVGDSSGESSHLSSPSNRPDEECDGRHFVFVHGYNVDPVGSRNWANQMFKRLWWAGSKSMFTAVDWKGDESHKHLPVVGEVSPNYYINVKNAFVTAPQATASINALPGEKVMLAHSLGNMLVSSAAKDYGLGYSKYYMLNAAVPMEAYDTDADASAMIDSEWRNVPLSYRASDWNTLFHVNDFRSSLSWRGRFAGIANAINCYSPTEDVLANPEEGQLTLVGGVWKIQELTKGTTLWHELNSLPFLNLNVACEGGWGINSYYSLNPLWYVYQYGFTEKAKNDLTCEDAITHPLFTPFRSESEAMHSTNLFTIADASYRDELRAKFLADAIPATSFAAGANYTRGLMDNHNVQDDIQNGWPTQREEKTPDGVISKWLHSDLKDVSFFYVYQLFNKVIKGE